MQNLREMELSELIDLLAQYTAKYSGLLAEEGNDKEYWSCKQKILVLQREIEIKKNLMDSKPLNSQDSPVPKQQH